MTRQIPWLRVFVEGVVIVGSILLAFGIDAWWDGVQERRLELEYAERLKDDLAGDTLRFSEIRVAFDTKADVLRELLGAEGTPSVRDADAMMARLNFSTYNGVAETNSATFRKMENSGTLGLLRDVGLRTSLAEYHAFYELLAGILADPMGPYQEVLTAAIPGELWYASTIDSTHVDPGELDRGLRRLASHPDLEGILNSELAYATELIFYTQRFKTDATALLAQLAEAYPDE